MKNKLDIHQSLNKFLPNIELFAPKNEVDYYGLSYYFINKLNINYNYSYSSWVHGWIYNKLKFIEQFNSAQYSPHYKIVANNEQLNFLKHHGFNKVLVAGYPYIYIDSIEEIKRYKGSLLIIPPHNTNHLNHEWNEEKYLKSLLPYKKIFDSIFFCIHQECFKKKKWLNNLNKYNFNYVIGANSHDKNSLLRTKVIFQHFEFVHAPTIGAAIPYAALDGCKVSISNNYLEYNIDGYKSHPLYKKNKKYIEYEIYTKSKTYIFDKFNFLFVEPEKSNEQFIWAKNQLEIKNKIDIKKIPNILGWESNQKLQFYIKKKFHSLKRKVFL